MSLVVDDMQKLKVGQPATERVGVGRTETPNDEVRWALAAREALSAHVELVRGADRLGVDRARQRRQQQDADGEGDDDGGGGMTGDSGQIPPRRRRR